MKAHSSKRTMRFFSLPFSIVLWASLPLILFLAGCASMTGSGSKQALRLTSSRDGTVVFQKDKQVGVTPSYSVVKRGKNVNLKLTETDGSSRSISLKSHYRWGDSFGANLIFLQFAPVGWLIDLITGAAWDVEDPPLEYSPPASPRLVAIAPPLATDQDLADDVGRLISENLKSQFNLIPYDQSAPLFEYYDSDEGLSNDREDRSELFAQLNADHVLLGKVTIEDSKYVMRGEVQNVFNFKTHSAVELTLEPRTGWVKGQQKWRSWLGQYFSFSPNTLFVNFASGDSELIINNQTYYGERLQESGFFEKSLEYISAVSLSHLERPRPGVPSHFKFQFVPNFNVSHRKLRFEDYSPLANVVFDRWFAAIGYGPEIGYLSPIGYTSFHLLPQLTWTHLKSESEYNSGKTVKLGVSVEAEIAHNYFFSDHFLARIFVRSIGEDNRSWTERIRDNTGQNQFIENASYSMAGFSIGYYLPSRVIGDSNLRFLNK